MDEDLVFYRMVKFIIEQKEELLWLEYCKYKPYMEDNDVLCLVP